MRTDVAGVETAAERRRGWWIIALLCLLQLCIGIHHGLWTPDEPREAELGREMWLAPGVIPTLNGQPFIEKPPLYYWSLAAVFALVGHPSADAARCFSALCGALTLLTLFCWVRRAQGTRRALWAVLMLATGSQFLISTHWVLLDPLLMLFTTLAFRAGWEVLHAGGGARWRVLLCAALALALWTKGPIGPVMVGAGLAAAGWLRPGGWRALQPWWLAGWLALCVGLLAALIRVIGGPEAFYQWFYVNQVDRLLHPRGTGHEQPLLYYLWTLPEAVAPWLVPLWYVLRPSFWRPRRAADPLPRFALAASVAMLLVLSASVTKRQTYLLPLLPVLCAALATGADELWGAALRRRWPLVIQLALLAVYALVAPAADLAYLRAIHWQPLAWLLLLLAGLFWMWRPLWRQAVAPLWLFGAYGLLAAGAWLTLAPHALDDTKDMAPFVSRAGELLPAGAPVHALNVDETLAAIVPFATGRRLIDWSREGRSDQPEWVLIQEDSGYREPPPAGYRRVERRSFGPGRALGWWRREASVQPAFTGASGAK